MVREFSEEKKEEIFKILDEIDMKEWKPFMEWCGSSAEEFGDWPERLNVSAYTRYVDEYHKKVLELNEMTRNRVNTVFENVAEIETRYAGRMKECQVKIKEQIAMVNTMTEFMQSMTDGIPNMALINKGSVNENCIRQERKENGSKEGATFHRSLEERYIERLYKAGWISEEEYRYLQYLMTTAPHVLQDGISYYRNTRDVNSPEYQWIQENRYTLDLYLENNDLDWSDEIKQQVLSEYYDTYVKDAVPLFVTAGAESALEVEILDWERCQDLYDRISITYADFYSLYDYFYSKDEILQILVRALHSGDITQDEYDNLKALFTEMFDSTDEGRIQTLYEEIKNEYDRIVERNQYIQIYINEDFLENIGFDFDELGIDNFVVELKRGMIQYNITDEESIQMFLANCMVETGGTDLLEKYNNRGDAGSGLIQVTGDTQNQFLKMIQSRYDSDSEEYKLIEAIRSGYTYSYDENGNIKYDGYYQPEGVNISPQKYIADNYPVESAVWYWGGYSEKCIVYTDARDKNLGCVTCTINEYVELYQSSCAGREEDLFIATQYYVNSAKLRAPYLQQLCEGYCDQNQHRYCITYFSNGNIVDLANIEAAAQNNDDTIISQLPIDKVEYQDQNPDAPRGCEARFYYYYRILALREEMEMQ